MGAVAPFDYDQAFAANLGLFTTDEQSRLRRAMVAIPGMGGVGGAYLLTLTRLGIERFSIADSDTFELRNFNRQVGASLQTVGRAKTEVMVEMARAINPGVSIRVSPEGIHSGNIDPFLADCDLVLDGLDFFAIEARRLLFARARARGLTVITCGPVGFGAALLIFTPDGPSFDDFMDLRDGLSYEEQIARFAVGLAPAGLHVPYLDPSSVNLKTRRGPSAPMAIDLCAGLVGVEATILLLKRRPVWAVPRYTQFDAYRQRYHRGTLRGGNRHPLQRLKLSYIKRRFLHDLPA